MEPRELEKIIEPFLAEFPKMALKPSDTGSYLIEGFMPVVAKWEDGSQPPLDTEIEIRIEVPGNYPNSLPRVFEIGESLRIPQKKDFHNDKKTGFCLGSPRVLLESLHADHSLTQYAYNNIIPFFAQMIRKNEGKREPISGELSHGPEGLIEDFYDGYGLNLSLAQICIFFHILSLRKRVANKYLCPQRLGNRFWQCKCVVCKKLRETRLERNSRKLYRTIAAEYYEKYQESIAKKGHTRKLVRLKRFARTNYLNNECEV